jgi:hypothetical protein
VGPSKRDFLRTIAGGLPLMGYGAAGVLSGCSSAAGAQQRGGAASVPVAGPPIYVASQFGTTAAAVAQAILLAAQNQQGMVFESGNTFTLDSTVLGEPGFAPPYMLGYGATLVASADASGALVTISNPQDTSSAPGSACFLFAGFNIDGHGRVAQTLALNGSQFARYQDLTCTGSTDVGIAITGAPAQGVYTNEFSNVLATNNAGAGWYVTTAAGQDTPYNAGNAFVNCSAQYNGGPGWSIDQANNTYLCCDAEDNDGAGFSIARTQSSAFIGGYSENNPNANPGDQSFILTAGSAGVLVIGGRHSGVIAGSVPGNGNVFLVYYQNNSQGTDRGYQTGYVPFGVDPLGLIGAAGLGVANAVPNPRTPTGATVSALQVFDANGNALGYVPVYETPW